MSNDFRQGEDQAVADLDALLQSFVGKSADAPVLGPDAVNLPMIRHFVEAVGDENPVYIDDEAAVATGRPRLIAPPHMLQTWIMPGLRRKLAGMTGPPSPPDKVYALLEESGFTSIVATNSEQEYHRELEVGDRVRALSTLESVSAEKKTALGRGHFVTTRIDYTTDAGDPVATMLFRVLLYEPAGAAATSGDAPAPKPLTAAGPPRPILTQDNAFFFEQLDEGRLVVQRCADCSVLRHPPQPRCAECGSLDWDWVTSSGRGTVHSFVVVHHPQMPGFEYPLAVGLVELEEGTRIVAPLVGVDPADVQIGAPVEARIAPGTGDGEARLAFAPMVEDDTSGAAAAPRRVKAGESLPDLDVPLTRTLIVAGAIATRDYQDVHHDVVLAHAKGSPDIFMNILTTNGWVGRFVTDWAGPEARIESVAIRLGAPNYPDDRMVMSGKVVSVEALGDDSVRLTVGLKGSNSIGDHVSGTVTLRMPGVPG